VTVDQYTDLQRPNLSWLIHGLIPRPSMMMLMGPPKVGKSWLAMDIARAVAGGKDFLGRKTIQGRVLYIQQDTSEAVWRDRLSKQINLFGISFPPDLLMVHPDDTHHPMDILKPESRMWMTKAMLEVKPALVVIDVLREIHNADENDSTGMKLVGDYLGAIFSGVALLLVHHMKKIPAEVSNPDPTTYGRGSSYITGKMDGYWMLHKGQLRIESRFDEGATYKAVHEEDGTWSFPEVAAQKAAMDKVLALCAEFPGKSHHALADEAKARWNMSRAGYYRHLKGRSCAHQAAIKSSLVIDQETGEVSDAPSPSIAA
jgi:RecA-family ATPase